MIHSLATLQTAKKPAPSGIAQLRQASQNTTTTTAAAASSADFMNLDDFLVPSSIGSPAGIESPSAAIDNLANVNSVAPSAIPIKGRKDQHLSHNPLVPASLPQPPHDPRRNNEFGYVQRRVRKTSVDERKVSQPRFIMSLRWKIKKRYVV